MAFSISVKIIWYAGVQPVNKKLSNSYKVIYYVYLGYLIRIVVKHDKMNEWMNENWLLKSLWSYYIIISYGTIAI